MTQDLEYALDIVFLVHKAAELGHVAGREHRLLIVDSQHRCVVVGIDVAMEVVAETFVDFSRVDFVKETLEVLLVNGDVAAGRRETC